MHNTIFFAQDNAEAPKGTLTNDYDHAFEPKKNNFKIANRRTSGVVIFMILVFAILGGLFWVFAF